MISLVIHGSCVSRDVVAFAPQSVDLQVVDYFARSSLVSVVSKPVLAEVDLDRIENRFRRRMVTRDLNKDFLKTIGGLNFDLLVVDLIDERFPVLQFNDGSIATVSGELKLSGVALTGSDRALLRASSRRFLSVWLRSMATMCHELDRLGVLEKLVVNKVFWAKQLATGEIFGPPRYSQDYIQKSNDNLAFMYEQVGRLLRKEQIMEYPENLFVGDPNHKHGMDPFHYTQPYYAAALTAIESAVARLRAGSSPRLPKSVALRRFGSKLRFAKNLKEFRRGSGALT